MRTFDRQADRGEADAGLLGSAWGDGANSRRDFLKLAAAASAALAIPFGMGGCVLTAAGRQKLDFHDDFGVLNLAYALETVESEFYARIIKSPPPDLKPGELEILTDIGLHEKQHQRFFKRALGILAAHLPDRNFDGIDFSTRQGVLTQAKAFEDLGVAGYNGAGDRLKLAEFLTIAGKIVSVEARHASTIRDLLNPGSRDFAGDDVVDGQGMDPAMPPREVLAQAQRFFRSPFTISGL